MCSRVASSEDVRHDCRVSPTGDIERAPNHISTAGHNYWRTNIFVQVRFRGIVENPDEDDTATQETARAARGSEAKDGSDEENSPMKPLPT